MSKYLTQNPYGKSGLNRKLSLSWLLLFLQNFVLLLEYIKQGF